MQSLRAAVAVLTFAAGCASTSNLDVLDAGPDACLSASVADAPADARSAAAAAVASLAAPEFVRPTAWRAAGSDAETEVVVRAPRGEVSELREEDRIGSNRQPEWTTQRRFATTRAYVISPGQVEFEQWYRVQHPRQSGPVQRWQTELGVGFEGGWQLDFYANSAREPGGPLKHTGFQAEVRKALAPWGEIWANPTLYLEYLQNHRENDKLEAKLLLADEICPRWHWALNFVYEKELGGVHETELALAGGVSYSLLDRKFAIGVEAKAERVTGDGFRSQHDAENEFLIGPSFQWRPTENTHVDFVPLFGVTKGDRRDPRTEIYVVFGIDFGPEGDARRAPTSSRSK